MEAALKIETENPNIPQEAAIEAMHLNQVEKAITYSRESIRRKPDGFAQLGNHAMNLLIGGFDSEAENIINKALEIEPTDKINIRIRTIISEVILGKRERPMFENSIKL